MSRVTHTGVMVESRCVCVGVMVDVTVWVSRCDGGCLGVGESV